MKNAENITIVLLLITAGMLAAMLITSYATKPAYAGNESVKQGDYVMTAAAWTSGTDLLYIVDIAQRRMVVYFLDPNDKAIVVVDDLDLQKAFRR